MALLDRFKKKTKKEEVPRIEKPEEREKEKADQQEIPKKKKPQKIIGKKVPQAYRIIKEPHITEKASFLADQNRYVFKVSFKANKVEIKKVVEALYGVKVEKVHLIH